MGDAHGHPCRASRHGSGARLTLGLGLRYTGSIVDLAIQESEGNSLVRVRYAPSPTGTLHIGGARTALFNYLYARHHGGSFVLRVEDTDQTRQVVGSEAAMLEGLRSLGILWDEGPEAGGEYGPYHQSERTPSYRQAARQLLAEGKVYRCFCTPEALAADREERQRQHLPPRYVGRCRELSAEASQVRAQSEPFVLRLKVPTGGATVVHDLIRGEVKFDNQQLDDFVIMKPDDTPVYNFAVVIDDAAMAISHVIRGEEHLSNTPKQILVAEALGLPVPAYAHVPMILAPDRSKLSKRHGATSVEEYRQQGILPAALVNYLLLLGWSSPDGEEIMNLQRAAADFDLDRVQHTAAIYDQKKLEWMNAQYLRSISLAALEQAVIPFLEQAAVPYQSGPSLSEALELTRERARTLVELSEGLRFLFDPPRTFDAKGVEKQFADPALPDRLDQLVEALQDASVWDHDGLAAIFDATAERLEVKRAALIHPTRLALTGKTVGPGLFELIVVLGQDRTLAQLRWVAAALRTPSGVAKTEVRSTVTTGPTGPS